MDEELLSAKTNHRRGESMPTVSNDTQLAMQGQGGVRKIYAPQFQMLPEVYRDEEQLTKGFYQAKVKVKISPDQINMKSQQQVQNLGANQILKVKVNQRNNLIGKSALSPNKQNIPNQIMKLNPATSFNEEQNGLHQLNTSPTNIKILEDNINLQQNYLQGFESNKKLKEIQERNKQAHMLASDINIKKPQNFTIQSKYKISENKSIAKSTQFRPYEIQQPPILKNRPKQQQKDNNIDYDLYQQNQEENKSNDINLAPIENSIDRNSIKSQINGQNFQQLNDISSQISQGRKFRNNNDSRLRQTQKIDNKNNHMPDIKAQQQMKQRILNTEQNLISQITNNMTTKKSIDPGLTRSSIKAENQNGQFKYQIGYQISQDFSRSNNLKIQQQNFKNLQYVNDIVLGPNHNQTLNNQNIHNNLQQRIHPGRNLKQNKLQENQKNIFMQTQQNIAAIQNRQQIDQIQSPMNNMHEMQQTLYKRRGRNQKVINMMSPTNLNGAEFGKDTSYLDYGQNNFNPIISNGFQNNHLRNNTQVIDAQTHLSGSNAQFRQKKHQVISYDSISYLEQQQNQINEQNAITNERESQNMQTLYEIDKKSIKMSNQVGKQTSKTNGQRSFAARSPVLEKFI